MGFEMRTPRRPHLPDGYWVVIAADRLHLFGPQGRLLATRPAAPGALQAIEKAAWPDVWDRIEAEIHQEIREFRTGVSLEHLSRIRQYLRLLQALAEARPEKQAAIIGARWIDRLVGPLPRVAGVAVAGLLVGLLLSAIPQLSGTPETAAPAPPMIAPASPQVARLDNRGGSVPSPLMSKGSIDTKSTQSGLRRTRIAGYATVFGQFTTFEAAQVRARLDRTKGYLARVVWTGRAFRVVGRVHPVRSDAIRMAKIFREIGLPATVQSVRL